MYIAVYLKRTRVTLHDMAGLAWGLESANSQPVEALDGGGGGAGAVARGAVVGKHGAADDVGLPVDARDADAVVAGAGDDARTVGAVALLRQQMSCVRFQEEEGGG